MEFQNKTALITGAASGIALNTAQMLAEQGATIVMIDIDEEKVTVEAANICQNGGKAEACVLDIRDYASVKAAVVDARDKHGALDILINCAGGCAGRVFGENCSFDHLSVEALEWGIDVNFKGPLYLAHAALPFMISQKSGVIVNIGSVEGVTGTIAAEYSAAKSGMVGFTKSLALIGAPHGVRACCISPGPIMTRPAMARMYTPMGRAGEPEEVAHLILYLCSDKAAFITGDNFMIDGGRSCGGRQSLA